MKTLLTLLAMVAVTTLATLVLFLAVVGSAFLLGVDRQPVSTEHCPRVVRYEDGSLVCIVPMQAEDDNLMIVRGE